MLSRRLLSHSIASILRSPSPSTSYALNGWIRTKRKTKSVLFLELSDGSTHKGIQCTLPPSLDSTRLSIGSSVTVKGKLKESQGSEQRYEIEGEEVDIIGDCDASVYPVQKKRHSYDFMRTISHLRTRTRLFGSIARIRHTAISAIHSFFEIHTPILTSLDCEGGGEVFQVTHDVKAPNAFFKTPTFLSVSSQLHLEMMMHSLSRVYTLSPCFRADHGSEHSTRHMAEFYMLEAEWAWIKGVSDLTDFVERLTKYVVQKVVDDRKEDLEYLEGELATLRKQLPKQKVKSGFYHDASLCDRLDAVQQKFERISYCDAFRELSKVKSGVFKRRLREWGEPLQTEHERYLTDVLFTDGRGVFVSDYPEQCKAFYMRRNDALVNSKPTVACFDLLLPGLGEVVGGSVREERYTVLREKMEAAGLLQDKTQTSYEWYLQLRQQGSCPHGGFGLGFDRLMMYMTGMENIRDVVSVGRWKGTCQF